MAKAHPQNILIRFVKRALIWVAALLSFFIILVAALLLKPQVILNSAVLRVALRAVRPAGIHSQYDQAELHVASDNLLRKKLTLHFKNLCLDSDADFLNACFSEILLNVKVQIQRPYLKIIEIGPTIVAAKNFNLNLKPRAPAPASKPSHLLSDLLPDDLRNLQLDPIDLQVHQIKIKTPALAVEGDVRLSDNGSLGGSGLPGNLLGNRGAWQIQAVLVGVEKKVGLSTSTQLTFAGNGPPFATAVKVDGVVEARTPLTKPFKFDVHASLFGPNDEFRFKIASTNACLQSKDGPIQGCIKELDLGVTGKFNAQGFFLEALAPVKVVSDQFFINIDQLTTPSAPPGGSRPSGLQASGPTPQDTEPQTTAADQAKAQSEFDFVKQFSTLQFRDVGIALRQVDLLSGGEHIFTHVAVKSSMKSDGADLLLNLKVEEPQSKLSAHAELSTSHGHDSLILSGPLGLKADTLVIETRANLQLTPRLLEFGLDTLVESKPWAAHAFVKGTLAGDNLKGSITKLGAHNENMIFQAPETTPCFFDIDLNRRSQMGCNISLKFTDKQLDALVGAPQLNLKMDVSTTFPPAGDSPWSGYVALEIPELKSEVIRASGEVRALFDKTKFNKELLKTIGIRTDLNLEIADFAAWVNKTYATSFAVPAPINALRGRVAISSRGTLKGVYSKLPLHFVSDLQGQDQAMVIEGDGTLSTIARGDGYVPQLDAQIILKQVQLMLPRYPDSKLSASPPPALVPDGRITNMKAVRKAAKGNAIDEPGFLYNITLKTAPNAPIKLVSNLTQAPIPIAFDLTLKTIEGLRGTVGIEKFPLDLFGHKAEIIRLNLKFLSMRLEENLIDGEASVAVNDYKIIINLSGNPKTPVVRFYSVPPLPQNQIIPVVLFGKTPESLDVDQKNSSNSFQAALQDQALPLASFFFLASTPIESVGYDTQQQVFTAKLRIKQGLSLDVGSNGSQLNQIGLNKRLGKSWSIRTYVRNPTDQTQTQSVTAFLEKLFQY